MKYFNLTVRQWEIALLAILVMTSFALRAYRLPQRIYWKGDQARDLLISYQITDNHKLPPAGATATGFRNSFFYPPVFYYLLSGIGLVTRDPALIAGMFTVFYSICAALLYVVVRNASGRTTGIIFAVFYACSSEMIYGTFNIGSLYLMPVVFILGFYITRRHRSADAVSPAYIGGYGLLILSAAFHYSALLFIFPLLLYDAALYVRKGRRRLAMLLFFWFTSISVFLFWPLISWATPMRTVKHMSPTTNISVSAQLIPTVLLHHRRSINILFGFNQYTWQYVSALLVCAGLLAAMKTSAFRRALTITFAGIEYFILMMSLKQGDIAPDWNYILLNYLYVYFISLVTAGLIRRASIWAKILGWLLFAASAFLLINNFAATRSHSNSFERSRQSALRIISDSKASGIFPDFYTTAAGRSFDDGFESYRVLYFLEQNIPGYVQYDPRQHRLTQTHAVSKTRYHACLAGTEDSHECIRSYLESNPEFRILRMLPPNGDTGAIYVLTHK